jgi:hypothetical protein
MSIYQIVLRIGWIFKTESIIMPAFMDLIGGAAWQRGCLPMLNRLGQSMVPLLFSDQIRNVPRKRNWLCLTSIAMGGCFLLLAVLWWISGGQRTAWWPFCFLGLYALFFTATGMNQVLFSTLTGKLVLENLRGRLSAVGSLIGGFCAIIFALIWLRPWLESTTGDLGVNPQFGLIFGFTGVLFVAAGFTALRFIENPDEARAPLRSRLDILRASSRIVFENHNFRLLAISAALFGMSMTLFPHYQSIARERLGLGFGDLDGALSWIIAQHIGASVLSVPAGGIADRYGNRLVLQILMGTICIAPVLLLVLHAGDIQTRLPYLVMFFLLGLTPITFRFYNNYALETTEESNHPAYLSTLGVCFALPVILSSTLVGLLMDVLGLRIVFLAVLVLLLFSWAVTFRLQEPRHNR